jgi:thiamine transport system substrate-binding protein
MPLYGVPGCLSGLRGVSANPMNLIRIMPAEGQGQGGCNRPSTPSSRATREDISMRFLLAALAVVLFTVTAQAKETLRVLTYDSFISEWGPGPAVKKAFEAECDCTLEWVGVADGVAMLNRLKLEGAASTADVVLGFDTNLTAEAAATGLFEPHGIEAANLKVPGDWTDPNFLPFDWGYFAVVYDTKALPKDAFTSLKALVESDRPEKIVIQDPRTSTPGLGLMLWVRKVYGDKAPEAWAKLKGRVLTVTPGWSEAYGLFTKGEAPMVLSYTTSPAYHMIAETTDRYQAFAFEEGHYMQIEVAGLLKASKNRELARKFLAFMLTPAFQDIIPETNWMYPAAGTSKPLNPAFNRLVKPAASLAFTPEEVAANRKAWVEEWLKAMSQ